MAGFPAVDPKLCALRFHRVCLYRVKLCKKYIGFENFVNPTRGFLRFHAPIYGGCPIEYNQITAPVAQRTERLTSNQIVGSSNLPGSANDFLNQLPFLNKPIVEFFNDLPEFFRYFQSYKNHNFLGNPTIICLGD